MGGTFLEGSDPAALLLIAVAVVGTAIVVGRAVYLHRRKFPRWLKSLVARKRLDVIVRDVDRLAEHDGALNDSEQAVWQPFEVGRAAMAACQWDQAIDDFKRAHANADKTRLAPLLNQHGICLYMKGQLGDALREFQGAARLAQQRGDKRGMASTFNNIGVIRRYFGELDVALKFFRDARALARESGSQETEALCLGNIGHVLRQKGELGPALKAQEDALAISRRVMDQPGVASSLGNIGSILRDRGESDKALERYSEAVEIARKSGYKLGVAIELGNIGSLYRSIKGETDRALKSHEAALALSHEIGYRLGVATELANIGLILTSKRMYERAVPYLAESLVFFVTAGVADGPRQALYGLSRCDDLLGREKMQGLLRKAGLSDDAVADKLARIDQIRTRRPWQIGRLRNPFAPAVR
jgi:tetratricopeptide (TPR) repeat protein